MLWGIYYPHSIHEEIEVVLNQRSDFIKDSKWQSQDSNCIFFNVQPRMFTTK